MTKSQKTIKVAEEVAFLNQVLAPGAKLFSILRKRSDTSRSYDFYAMGTDGFLVRLTFSIATVTGYTYSKDVLRVNGCGFNATQDVTDALSRKLGFELTYQELQ